MGELVTSTARHQEEIKSLRAFRHEAGNTLQSLKHVPVDIEHIEQRLISLELRSAEERGRRSALWSALALAGSLVGIAASMLAIWKASP